MEAVFGLLLMLLGVSHGVEIKCEFRQKHGARCYGALGGTVALKLMDQLPDRFTIFTNNGTIIRWRKSSTEDNKNKTKYVFTPNDRTFRINNLERSDTGDYLLAIYNHSGVLLENRYLQLSIQAPVSSARLVTECLSQGEMRVSCSSEGGDSPQYSWTLNGQMLAEDKLLSGTNETDNITLTQDVSGLLACSVKNHVSHLKENRNISTCGFIFINCTVSNETRIAQWVYKANNTLCVEPTTTPPVAETTVGNLPTMVGVLAALVVLLAAGGAAICALKRKKSNQLKEEGDGQELTYADVTIKQRGQAQPRADPEVEVEYGQIKFSGQPRRTVGPRDEDCVYAKVR